MKAFLLIEDDELAIFVGFLQHILALLYVTVIVLQSQERRN